MRRHAHIDMPSVVQDINGALFASPEVKEKGGAVTRSSINYRPFEAWAPQSDWTMTLDQGEEAEVCMCACRCVFACLYICMCACTYAHVSKAWARV